MDYSEAAVYVNTYKKYNAGNLDGEWMDLTEYSDKDEFLEACKELHKDEVDSEFMFSDHENIPKCFIDESFISEKLWEFLEACKDCDLDSDVIEYFMDHNPIDKETDIEEWFEKLRYSYIGEANAYNQDEVDTWYGEYMVDNGLFGVEIPSGLIGYIDYESIGRDARYNSEVFNVGRHVFYNNF